MHPGEYLNEVLCALGLDPGLLAIKLGVPIRALEPVLTGERDISPEFALRLDRYFGSGTRMWLDLQSAYSLARVERSCGRLIEEQVLPSEHEPDLELMGDEFEEVPRRGMYECTALPIGIDGGPPAGLINRMAPVHPGEILNEDLEFLGLTLDTFAANLAIPVAQMKAILSGERDVDAEFALRLERYFGSGARMWMNLQTAYSLKVAERELAKTIAKEITPREVGEAAAVEAA